jgi:hypothetical protein
MTVNENEYSSFNKPYILAALETGKDIIPNLEDSLMRFFELLAELPKEKQLFAYAEGKWTIKELVQHMIDTERIFAYRAHRISRGDQTELSGFDENYFMDHSNANEMPYNKLLEEFLFIRNSTIAMFKGFSNEMLLQKGVASESVISVRALGLMLTGHVLHHLGVIQERYLY